MTLLITWHNYCTNFLNPVRKYKNYCVIQLQRLLFVNFDFRTPFHYGNIMYDRRVVRGNTYAQNIIPTVCVRWLFYLFEGLFLSTEMGKCVFICPWKRDPADPAEAERHQGNKRRAFQQEAREQLRALTPEAVQGRTHVDVQTGHPIHTSVASNSQIASRNFFVFFFRALSGGIERHHRHFWHGLSNRCFPG